MPTQRIADFDTWRPGYANAVVRVYLAGTTTLASIFTDEALTSAAPNPQTLIDDGNGNGKFGVPLYVGVPFELNIDNTDSTGTIRPPLTNTEGADLSKAVARAEGGSRDVEIEDIIARVIHAEDYGTLGADQTTTNTNTLTAAIGAAAANNGGVVMIPAGTFTFSSLTLPAGVVLEGVDRQATELQSQTGDKVVTLTGDRAGLRRLTLDGINLQSGSIGVYSKANDQTVLEDVLVERFETGVHCRGGRDADWKGLFISGCADGAKLHGDIDATGGNDGDDWRGNNWTWGKIDNCTGIGLHLSYEDRFCILNRVSHILFEDCTGTAVGINGARFTALEDCSWTGCTTNIAVSDDDDTDKADENTVIGLRVAHGVMNTGALTFADTCQDVMFDRVQFEGVEITLTVPEHSVLAQDCTEDEAVVLKESGTRWIRSRTGLKGSATGVTTDAVATKAWSFTIKPGQIIRASGRVLALRTDGTENASYHVEATASRPGSTLGYDAQIADFTVGSLLTGATSGATALIIADTDSGTSGTLTLRNITGVFEDNEQITDAAGGDALVNGVISHQNAVIDGAVASIGTAVEDVAGWNATFAVSGIELELQVTGAASQNVEWHAHVDVVTS